MRREEMKDSNATSEGAQHPTNKKVFVPRIPVKTNARCKAAQTRLNQSRLPETLSRQVVGEVEVMVTM